MSDKGRTKVAHRFILNSRFGTFMVGPFGYHNGRSDKDPKIGKFTQSIRAFPTFSVRLRDESDDPVIVNLARGHQIIYEISLDDEPFLKQFAGEISQVVIETKGGRRDKIKIEAESPFVKLQNLLIDGSEVGNLGFRELINYMMTNSRSWGRVNFDADVPDEIAIIGAKAYPAFALLRQICFQRDLIFDIKSGDELRISRRLTREVEMLKNIPTIHANDILSMRITR